MYFLTLIYVQVFNSYRYTQKDRELTSTQKKLTELEGQISDLDAGLLAANRELEKWKEDCMVGYSPVAHS